MAKTKREFIKAVLLTESGNARNMTANPQVLFDGDSFAHNGRSFVVSIEFDQDHRTPWEENDGHGAVSKWVTRH